MAKILIVDDDPLLVKMYQTKFESDGYQVFTAGDGEEGLAKAKSEKPDIILLDVMMPKKNGLEVLKLLKADVVTHQTPVVMLTNVSASEADSTNAFELGAVTYLVKASYTPKEVVQKVKEILSGYVHDVPQL